jgi:hypothetical protein
MSTGYTRTQLRQHLLQEVKTGKWHEWQEQQPGSSAEDLQMSYGPEMKLEQWNRMEVQNEKFLTRRVERASKGACDSLVLTWFTDAAGITQPYVGQVQAFLSQEPPWAVGTYAERQSAVVQIADVKWFEYAGRDPVVFDPPVFKRAFKAEPQGDFWACELLEAIPITMAPYLGSDFSPRNSYHQVLVPQVSVFKPTIAYQVDKSTIEPIRDDEV